MISNLSALKHDEPIGGWLARLLDPVAVASRRRVGEIIAGVEGANLFSELPMHLGTLVQTLAWRVSYDADELIWRGTHLPLYAPFIDSARLVRLRAAMIGSGPVRPTSVLGIHRCLRVRSARLRFCQRCRERDLRNGDVSWWRRSHQAAGVDVCPEHGGPLVESQFSRDRSWKVDYPMIEDARQNRIASPADAQSAEMAKEVNWLLLNRLKPHSGSQLRGAYFEALDSKGYLRGRRLRRTEFLRDYIDAEGVARLRHLGLMYDAANPYAWPAKVVLSAGGCHSPIQHLLLVHFLGLSAEMFLGLADSAGQKFRALPRGPNLRQAANLRRLWIQAGISQNKIARSFGVGVQTVRTWATGLGLPLPRIAIDSSSNGWERKREAMRKEWMTVRLAPHSRRGERVRKWLGRNDAQWHSQRLRPRARGSSPVNWCERDRILVTMLPAAAATLRECRPFRRITVTGLTATLDARHYWSCSDGRLPRLAENMRRVIENRYDFALRRIRELRIVHPDAPPWRIREWASIPRPLPRDRVVRKALGYL